MAGSVRFGAASMLHEPEIDLFIHRGVTLGNFCAGICQRIEDGYIEFRITTVRGRPESLC